MEIRSINDARKHSDIWEQNLILSQKLPSSHSSHEKPCSKKSILPAYPWPWQIYLFFDFRYDSGIELCKSSDSRLFCFFEDFFMIGTMNNIKKIPALWDEFFSVLSCPLSIICALAFAWNVVQNESHEETRWFQSHWIKLVKQNKNNCFIPSAAQT